ncbi:hypothetical protein F5Y05DRAFT_386497 [Hypoxylon sp. FL0543]|nr:hypothetical protein F5Y05DRAFT_386497 [Hypoxylon sp. FL0543]
MAMSFLRTYDRNLAKDEKWFLKFCFPNSDLNWKAGHSSWSDRGYTTSFATVPGIYVCFNIDTVGTEPKVKARNILKENYIAAHGRLSSLELIVYQQIRNVDVRNALTRAFDAMSKPKKVNGWLDIAPGEVGWEELETNNPFIIGLQRLLSENATEIGNASIRKVLFFIDTQVQDPTDANSEFHMKIELRR